MTINIKQVLVGSVPIGGNAPISIQSMTAIPLMRADEALSEIAELKNLGCDIVRAAIPDKQSAEALKRVAKESPLPIVADIHFEASLAVMAVEAGASKVRINPGNIGSEDRVRDVVSALKEHNVPIRVGVNSGSIEKGLLEKYGGPTAEGMVESAEKHISILEKLGFGETVVSLKASDVRMTVKANRLFRSKHSYPLHIGLTEAGFGTEGLAKSAVAIGALLLDGIGETVRVSLTGPVAQEVEAAKAILVPLGLRDGISVISCPTCARTKLDVAQMAKEVKAALSNMPGSLTVAVMGCAVNGPGEASHADIGIACGQTECYLFKKGIRIKSLKPGEATKTLVAEAIEMLKAA